MTHAGHPALSAHAADLPTALRRRFLAPLYMGRTVLDLDPPSGPRGRGRPSSICLAPDVMLQLMPVAASAAEERARVMLGRLRSGGVAVVASFEALQSAGLNLLAPYHAHYTQRIVTGALFHAAEYGGSRIAVLRDQPELADRVHIYLFSTQPVPPLDTGLLEQESPPAKLQASLLDPPLEPLPLSATRSGVDDLDDRGASLARRL